MTEALFPSDVTGVLKDLLGAIPLLTEIEVGSVVTSAAFTRPLRPSDPAVSLGIFEAMWEPSENTREIGGFGMTEPTISTYTWAIQSMVKHTDEIIGRDGASRLAKTIRSMLVRDNETSVALRQLSETYTPGTERVQRWGVRSQRFTNDNVDNLFVYITTTEFWLETESL